MVFKSKFLSTRKSIDDVVAEDSDGNITPLKRDRVTRRAQQDPQATEPGDRPGNNTKDHGDSNEQ